MNFNNEWSRIECCVCGIAYYVPQPWESARRRKGDGFHCPNGHSLHFGDNETDKLRRERDILIQEKARFLEEANRLRSRVDRHARTAAAYKGQVTKLRKRASAGLCPCCNRSFENLQRHMKTKHPHFGADHKEESGNVHNS